MEKEAKETFNATKAIFQQKNRQFITISGTKVLKNGNHIQTLLVTAPETAQEDVANAKMRGVQIMGKTIFPTGEEYWQYVNSEYPKKLIIRFNNLPALCDDETLDELMLSPDQIEVIEMVTRETQQTEWGHAFTGRAYVPIMVQNKEQEKQMKEWSFH